jgi:hypothetical protein
VSGQHGKAARSRVVTAYDSARADVLVQISSESRIAMMKDWDSLSKPNAVSNDLVQVRVGNLHEKDEKEQRFVLCS